MTILFVCTGNTCRSPMAEGYTKKLLRERGVTDVGVLSAGVTAYPGDPATEGAVRAMKKRGADISAHRASRLNAYHCEQADRIYAMTARHAEMVRRLAPECADRVRTLAAEDIPDPFGGDDGIYEACAEKIAEACERIVAEL